MSVGYEYSLSQDFPNGQVNGTKLVQEILAEPAIAVAPTGQVDTIGDDVVIFLKAALSPAEETALTALVGLHDGEPTPDDVQAVTVTNQINLPTTENDTPIFQPSIIPAGYYFYGTGAFDRFDAPAAIGVGPQIAIEATGPNNSVTVRGRFMHHIYILGGIFRHIGADLYDWISLLMEAPASSPEDRTDTMDGNANKLPTGAGFNIIVPAPNNDGAWNVDGATLEAGEINLNLCPVPSYSEGGTPAGYWDWNPLENPSLVPSAPGQGHFNLFDATLPLARQANRYPCIVDGNVTPVSSIKGKKILPHWVWAFTVYRKEAGTVSVAIRLDTARIKTV